MSRCPYESIIEILHDSKAMNVRVCLLIGTNYDNYSSKDWLQEPNVQISLLWNFQKLWIFRYWSLIYEQIPVTE